MKTVYRTIVATVQFVVEDKISDKRKVDVVTLDMMKKGRTILYKQLGTDVLIRHNLLQTKQAKIRRYSS